MQQRLGEMMQRAESVLKSTGMKASNSNLSSIQSLSEPSPKEILQDVPVGEIYHEKFFGLFLENTSPDSSCITTTLDWLRLGSMNKPEQFRSRYTLAPARPAKPLISAASSQARNHHPTAQLRWVSPEIAQ
jgi:hypothetical protein